MCLETPKTELFLNFLKVVITRKESSEIEPTSKIKLETKRNYLCFKKAMSISSSDGLEKDIHRFHH